MRFPSYSRVALLTTMNIILNAVTLGRYVLLEGRVRRGVFMNWARRFRYTPKRFVRPATEDEIVELVRDSRSLRVCGSGHSFNTGVVSEEALVSLDDYSGLVWKDAAEELIKEVGARPHLGKFCKSFTKADMAKVHQDNFARFLDLVDRHDPDGKFANEFTRRLFGHGAQPHH